MSLVFESDAFKQDPTRTATHVLLVACGDYPDLANAGYGGLPPLTSPRQSVEAMAHWFLGGGDGMSPAAGLPPELAFHNPDAPLGSVELLASPAHDYVTPAGQAKGVTRSILTNVREAYKRWLARLGDNADSRGVFYFCGHGVGDGVDQVLIADDFGTDAGDPWGASFHVSNTCQATIRKTKANLLFLIDACMEFSPDLVFQIDSPQSLVPGKKNGDPLCTEWLVLRATTTNRLAYAQAKDTARFTKALLQALRGYCGQQRAGQTDFDVTASQLREATAAFLTRMQQPGEAKWQKLGTPQGEGAWNVGLHVLTKRPSVLVELDVDPAGFRPVAQAFMERNGTPRELKALNGGPVQFVVPRGEWTYGASAVGGAFPEQTRAEQLLSQAFLSYRFPIP